MVTLIELAERVVSTARSLERVVAEASRVDGRSAAREVSELAESDLMAVLAAFGEVRSSSVFGLSALAAEVSARSGVARGANSMAKREGHGSATELAASVLDITQSEANTLIRVGHATRPTITQSGAIKPPRYPLVQQALGSGQLKFLSADVITKCLDGLGAIASAEQCAHLEGQLVEAAAQLSLADLKSLCLEARALLDPQGLERREAEQRKNRSLTMFMRDDGLLQIKWLLPPADAALVRSGIHAMVRQLGKLAPETAKRPWGDKPGEPQPYPAVPQALSEPYWPLSEAPEGRNRNAAAGAGAAEPLTAPAGARFDREGRPLDADATLFVQQLADAALAFFTHGTRCSNRGDDGTTIPTTQLVVRVNYDDLVAQLDAAGVAVGHIDGHPEPISIEQVRHLAVAAEIIPAVMGGKSEVLDWGRADRFFTRAQRLALIERDGGCAFPGCDSPPSFGDVHHIRWWERDQGPTDLSNGIVLCTAHHHRIHDQGWEISIHPPAAESEESSATDPPHSHHSTNPVILPNSPNPVILPNSPNPDIPHFIAPRFAYAAADMPGARTLPDGRVEIPGGRAALRYTLVS